jgi:hypothetical protein
MQDAGLIIIFLELNVRRFIAWLAVFTIALYTIQVHAEEDALADRATVQATSSNIKALLDQRPASLVPSEDERQVQVSLDQQIAERVAERQPAYERHVRRLRKEIEAIPDTPYFRLPVSDSKGAAHWFAGEIPALWQLRDLDDAVFTIAKDIQLHPENLSLPSGVEVIQHFSIGGTSAQSMVHPYPGDIDYDEHFEVLADSPEQATLVYADIIREFVGRNRSASEFEFSRLRVMPQKAVKEPETDYSWNEARIMDPANRQELARQVGQLQSGRINTDWRAKMSDGRFTIIGKIFSVLARDKQTGEVFFEAERLRPNFQGAYFGRSVPDSHQDIPIGEFALVMKGRVSAQKSKGNYLKVAKRSFNYCRVIGNLDCIDELVPVFSTDSANVYHYYKTSEAIAEALDPAWPSSILKHSEAVELLQRVAGIVETTLPVPIGTIPERPEGIARQLRAIAALLERRADGGLAVNAELSERLSRLNKYEINTSVQLGLKNIVSPVVTSHVE